MDKSPVVILNSIGPVLHSVPFNSQTLKVSLFSSVTDKIHERLLHLIDNSTTFNSLTEFKIWLLKQLKLTRSSSRQRLNLKLILLDKSISPWAKYLIHQSPAIYTTFNYSYLDGLICLTY